MSHARNYVFTLHEKDGEVLRLLDPVEWPEYVTFVVYQQEVAPDTGRVHFQGYLELGTKKSMTQLKEDIPDLEDAWFQPRRGNQRQAIAYAKKEDTRVDGPWEHGTAKNQGQRADLDAVKVDIDKGRPMKQIAEDHFDTWVRHHRAFSAYKRMKSIKRSWPMELVLYLGPSGTQKTKTAHEAYPDAYWKPKGKWWDNYDGEETVIIDEMYGSSFPFTELLQLLDRYPYSIETKGGTVEFISKRIVMTSNQEPEDWYDSEKTHQMDWATNPLNRRLTEFCRIIRTGEVHRRIRPVLAQFGIPQ